MPILNLSQRPNSVSIFPANPAGLGTFFGFVLVNTGVPVPNRVRLDLTTEYSFQRNVKPARSPIQALVVDNLELEPVTLSVQGSLSANPLGYIESQLGAFGTAIRRDVRELKKLIAFQKLGEPVVVVTPIDVFTSMSISIRDTHVGTNSVDLDLSFEEVRIVSPVTVAGVTDLDAILAGADAESNVGGQSASATTAPSGLGGGLG